MIGVFGTGRKDIGSIVADPQVTRDLKRCRLCHTQHADRNRFNAPVLSDENTHDVAAYIVGQKPAAESRPREGFSAPAPEAGRHALRSIRRRYQPGAAQVRSLRTDPGHGAGTCRGVRNCERGRTRRCNRWNSSARSSPPSWCDCAAAVMGRMHVGLGSGSGPSCGSPRASALCHGTKPLAR
jgi:hypothetical protein